MQRVSNGTQAASAPTPAAVSGTPGFFTAGAPGVTPATVVDPDFLNSVQEELYAFLTKASLTPSNTNNAQVLQAIQTLFRGQNIQNVAAGTWTCPAVVYRVKFRIWGGGGGGGGCSGSAGSSSGAGGGYTEGIAITAPGTPYTIQVGAGGSPGASSPSAGGNGGPSSFNGFGTATGGGGGQVASGGFATGIASPGVGSGGILTLTGQPGMASSGTTSAPLSGGGAAPFGGVGGFVGTLNGPGSPGQFPGGGGSGATTTTGAQTGGAGAPGMVLLEW